jgi:hypothetical protein
LIVPDGFPSCERVYLPFAADEDAKVSEIVSKVLLLANDHTIKDESILRQIRVPA